MIGHLSHLCDADDDVTLFLLTTKTRDEQSGQVEYWMPARPVPYLPWSHVRFVMRKVGAEDAVGPNDWAVAWGDLNDWHSRAQYPSGNKYAQTKTSQPIIVSSDFNNCLVTASSNIFHHSMEYGIYPCFKLKVLLLLQLALCSDPHNGTVD